MAEQAAPELLRSKDRRWDISNKRAAAVALLVREHGYAVSEVAKYLGGVGGGEWGVGEPQEALVF